MYESPRMRRLRNDLAALERLQSESTVFRFKAQGNPPQQYLIFMKGKSLLRMRGQVYAHDSHRVEIKLGSSYPRTLPEIRWVTPIYHPNISEIGMVCLGGYGTHWVPSIQLDELCNMLWDMARYHNYDIRSPYNRDAALWVASQTTFLFPMDSRPLRDLRAAMGRIESAPAFGPEGKPRSGKNGTNGCSSHTSGPGEAEPGGPRRVRQFMSRYRGIFRRTADPATSEPPATIGPELPGTEPNLLGRGPIDPVAPALNSDIEEIVLLDPETPGQPPEQPLAADDGITFIE
jgi:ubiquitin-protein ligase